MSLRSRATALLGLSVAFAGVPLLVTSPVQADVASKIAAFPYAQDWSNGALIATDNDWSGVPGVQGYRGDDLTALTGVDPQTILADGSASPTSVIANATVTSNTGGLLEIDGSTVAMQGSGTADVPHLVTHLDLTGRTGATFAFNAKDLDASADDATQQVAVQYRVGATGSYTNLPAGYIADATTTGAATQVTARSVPLPAATDGQADVFVRVLTTNAVGNDELVGIDDINITAAGGAATALSATDPGDKTGVVNTAIAPITLSAAGGTAPYTWTTSALPAGLTLSGNTISGTPTTAGTTTVTATATDSATPTRATSQAVFDIVVTAAPVANQQTIAQIQGTSAATTPLAGQLVKTQGVVTAVYATGGLNGFNVQTAGSGTATDATPNASDGIFVYGGSTGFATYPAVGDSVEVTGTAGEFVSSGSSVTQISSAAWTKLATALAPVNPVAAAWPTTDAAREAREGELVRLSNTAFTVTNSYATWQFGEVGLATGTTPLRQPTEFAAASDAAGLAAVDTDNVARRLTLDDGKSENFGGAASGTPSSWLDKTHPVRVGAAATLKGSFVVDQRNGLYKLQPQTPVSGLGTDVATFADTRPANASPADVGGDVKIGTFNVLNYFPTTGKDYVASGAGTCTYFNDRAGDPISNNTCTNNGPRGAAEAADLQRQQAKIVTAINKLGADVVSLEEIENSVKFGKDRDDAVRRLVAALNAAGGSWDYVRSPAVADRPTPAQEDVIRTAFIYDPATIAPVGVSQILRDEENFDNAREPLAQAFQAVGVEGAEPFAVIANHFKSKGDSNPPATGGNANGVQGAFNADRVGQAQALATFADGFATARGLEAVFLAGDFNSYSQEDPIRSLATSGYTTLESTDNPAEESYSFGGLYGSLDHVLANDAARELVTGSDIWRINAEESVIYQYSRFNNNVTDFYAPDQFASSDHNPEVVGLAFGTKVNLLNINDFHGRIDTNTTRFATTIEQLRQQQGEDSTLFLSAGDNIGASLFASALQDDAPTLDILDALGLATSSVGNHEFDKGFADLTGRVAGRADFSYLGANVYRKGTTTPALPAYRTFVVNGLRVGVIGAVTQETPNLVSPNGIADLDFGDPVAAVNRVAGQLSDGRAGNGEADVIVAEYHEGSSSGTPADTCASDIASDSAFGRIARDTVADVDAIFTGHTHKFYACDGPVPGSDGATRPIIQTGSYGENIGQIVLSVDPVTDEVTSYARRNVARSTTEDLTFPRVAAVKQITDAALARAAVVGNQPVGRIGADITTAYSNGAFTNGVYGGGTRDNRTAESTLGGLVANALRDGVSDFATPELGITNPGGLRAELLFAGSPATNPANTDGVVTFAEANAVLPFNNTVAIVKMTGAQIKAVLEQQWRPGAYLQLALSSNVRVTADATAAQGSRITSIHIDDQLVDPARTYTVSTLSFLATGGDAFTAFTGGSYVDTGLLDAQLWRDYLATGTAAAPLQPDFARQQVFTAGLPASLPAGRTSSFTLGADVVAPNLPTTGETLDLTSLGSPANTVVVATLGATELGRFPVTNGTAAISLAVPAGATGAVTLTANPSGTTVTVPIGGTGTTPPTTPTTPTTPPTTPSGPAPVVTVKVKTGKVVVGRTRAFLVAKIRTPSGAKATGTVKIKVKGQKNRTVTIKNGKVKLRLGVYRSIGKKKVVLVYLGNATTPRSKQTVTLKVVRP